MKLNKTKINKVIIATQHFIDNAKSKERFTDYGLTIYGCEVRNLAEYKEMLNYKTTNELDERLKELYQAI